MGSWPNAKRIEALLPLASQDHSRFSPRDIGILFPIWPTGHRHTIPDLAYGTSAASRMGKRWGSCARGHPYLPSVTVYIRSYPRHSIAHWGSKVDQATQDDPRPAIQWYRRSVYSADAMATEYFDSSTYTMLTDTDAPTHTPTHLQKFWSLHWSLSSGPTCSLPQKMRIHLFSTSPVVSASVGCCILNSSMISPTTLTKRSRSSTNCSRSPWPRNTSWLMTVSRSPGAKVSFSTTRNPYICMPSDAAAFCRSYKTMCWCCTNLVQSPRSRLVT